MKIHKNCNNACALSAGVRRLVKSVHAAQWHNAAAPAHNARQKYAALHRTLRTAYCYCVHTRTDIYDNKEKRK